MKQLLAKISLFIGVLLLTSSCDVTRRIPEGQHLLTSQTVTENGTTIPNAQVSNVLLQKPNSGVGSFFGIPLGIYVYNLARPNLDSILDAQKAKRAGKRTFWVRALSRKQLQGIADFKKSLNKGLKETGEAPVLVNDAISEKSAKRLEQYYANKGYFNAKATYEINRNENKRASVSYNITSGEPFIVDSLKVVIPSKVADSIYKAHQQESLITIGQPYAAASILNERARLINLYRNSGLYHFEADRIKFIADTLKTDHHARLELLINNRVITNEEEGYDEIPFKVHKITEVNIITDNSFANQNTPFRDTLSYQGFNFYAYNKINYRPQALANVIPLKPGDVYSDVQRSATLSRLNSLRTFKYPSIEYIEDPTDSTGVGLIATIKLTPLDRYKLRADFNVSTSNIQSIGLAGSGSILTRNVFRGAETLEFSVRGSIGASDDAANPEDTFFNIVELGADLKLTLPRIFFPFNTTTLIPADWQPSTTFSVGFSSQENIGLDRQAVTGALSYQWSPSPITNYKLDLSEAQYVRNLNASNYFNVYANSFDSLNELALETDNVNPAYFEVNSDGQITDRLTIPNGASSYIRDVQNGVLTVTPDELRSVNALEERRDRLTQNNLIISSAFTYTRNTKENLFDDTFSRLRARVEFAGNLLDIASSLADLPRDDNGASRVFGVRFSQYAKTEVDYIKHWGIGGNSIFAIRAFGGLAVPYGNSNSIPFIRSFFAGGPNDNRAWRAYQLGPGRSGGPNEFNEANLKLALNAELRFDLVGAVKGALFVDAGNIWNIWDSVEDPGAVFNGIKSLGDTAIGSGFGLRYDFDFFVFRLDVGFKTFEPSGVSGERWFRNYNFSKAVYNIGINYPF